MFQEPLFWVALLVVAGILCRWMYSRVHSRSEIAQEASATVMSDEEFVEMVLTADSPIIDANSDVSTLRPMPGMVEGTGDDTDVVLVESDSVPESSFRDGTYDGDIDDMGLGELGDPSFSDHEACVGDDSDLDSPPLLVVEFSARGLASDADDDDPNWPDDDDL